MDITTSYCIDLKYQFYPAGGNPTGEPRTGKVDARLMRVTSGVCMEALKLCTGIFLTKWDILSAYPVTPVKGGTCRRAQAEKLVHSTKANHAPYPEFDRLFPGMPSYTRRSIIADALGLVSSYVSNHRNWEGLRPSERGAEPVIGFPSRYGLTFYEQERDLDGLRDCQIRLKLSHNHHFKWWFGLALIRAGYMRAQKGGYRKRCYWSAYKAVLLESSFLDSSACSLIYFFIASSVILPIVET